MNKHIIISIALMIFTCETSIAQKDMPLYEGTIPNSTGYVMKDAVYEAGGRILAYYKVGTPSLKIYLPENKNSNNTGLIIIPGGGYGALAYESEGLAIAEPFVKRGIACFILKYRLPDDSIMKDRTTGPLQDAQQAIKLVRMNAKKWNVDPNKIGVIGYSAGGHLASTLGTHYEKGYISNPDNISLRPDFMILVYPVITMREDLTHMGSRNSLLSTQSPEQVKLFSNEEQVNAKTPPTYLTHTGDDQIVNVNNSILFYQALVKNGVNAEMHLYPKGDHGFTQRLPVEEWLVPMLKWMSQSGFYKE